MIYLLKSILTTLGLSIYFSVIGEDKGFTALYSALVNSPYLLIFSIIGLTYFFKKISTIHYKTTILQKIISFFFSLCTWLTTVYTSDVPTINQVLSGRPAGVLYSFCSILGMYWLLESIQKIILLLYYENEWRHLSIKSKWLNNFIEQFKKAPFLWSFALITLFWSIIAITTYPGTFMGDTMDQILMYYGVYDRAAEHPVLSTLTTGWFIQLGEFLGSGNIGIFLLTLFQLTLVSAAFSYAVSLFVKLTRQAGMGLAMVLLVGTIPSVHGTVLVLTKDIPFSAFFIVYIATLIAYFYDNRYFFQHKLYLVHVVSIILMMLFRYNTLHFVAPTLLIYLIGYFFVKKETRFYKSIIVMGIIGLVSANLLNTVLVNQFAEVQPEPKRREMLSVPFQQTARYAKYHDDEVTKEEKEIINHVLDYDVIRKNYNPYRSDPVKRTHKEEATSEEMSAYFKLFIKQSLRHPLLAFESLAASHSNLFNLNRSMNSYYDSEIYVDEPGEVPAAYSNFGDKHGFSEKRRAAQFSRTRLNFYRWWDRLPVLSQLNNYGSYIFLLFVMFAIYLRDKKGKYAAICIPALGIVGTLIAGPITMGYIRYFLPVILVVPVLFGFFLSTNKETTPLRRN